MPPRSTRGSGAVSTPSEEVAATNATDPGSDTASGSGPRRGSRVKKASSRLQEAASSASLLDLGKEGTAKDVASSSSSSTTTPASGKSNGKSRSITVKNRSAKAGANAKAKGQPEIEDSIDKEKSENDQETAIDDTYCICNGGDAPPMIGCEECGNWFHFKCIMLSQKKADQLAEYICQDCEVATGRKSKSTFEVLEGDGAEEPEEAGDDSDHKQEDSEEAESSSEDGDRVQRVSGRGRNKKSEEMEGDEEEDFEEDQKDRQSSKRKVSLKRKSDSDFNAGVSSSPSESKKKKVNPRKVSSTSSPSSSAGQNSSNSSKFDPVRSHALSQFETVLMKIFSQKSSLLMEEMNSHSVLPESVSGSSLNLLEKTGGNAQSDENIKEAKDYARELEEGLFGLYSEKALPNPSSSKSTSKSTSSSSTGKLYKDKFRTFLFGLKDSKNKTLHFRIATGDLPARELVKMKGEELANDKIRDEIEKKKKESLEMSIRNKEAERENNNGMMVNGKKLNHKGEVDLDFEYRKEVETRGRELEETMKKGAREEEENQPSSSTPTQNPPASKPDQKQDIFMEEALSAPSQLIGSGGLDSPSNGLLSPSEHPFDFNHAWTEDDGPVVEEPSTEPSGMDLDYHNHHHHHDSEFSNATIGAEESKEDGNDDLIDSFLGGSDDTEEDTLTANQLVASDPSKDTTEGAKTKGPSNSEEKQVELASPPRSTTPIGSPPPYPLFHKVVPLTSRPILWSGALTMPDVSTFSGNLYQIGGRPLDSSLSIIQSHFFPSEHSIIEGRIPSKLASDYLVQSRLSSRTELVVFAMRPEFNIQQLAFARNSEVSHGPDGIPLTQESNEKCFTNELHYFHSKERYGVIVPQGENKKEIRKVIKDFYVTPLLKNSPLPEWLAILKPDLFYKSQNSVGDGKGKGKEKEEEERKDLILLVAVLWKDGLEAELAKCSTKSNSFGSPYVNSSTPQHHSGFQSTAETSSVDRLRSNTSLLQNILKAVGDGGDSHVESNANVGFGSPSHHSSTPVTASTANNLSKMPHAQLENVLSANPGLVDQLLNSLKTGGTLATLTSGSSGSQAPGPAPGPPGPPGPPPRPPPSLNPSSSFTPPIHQAQPSYSHPYSSGPNSGPSPPTWNSSPPHHQNLASNWGGAPSSTSSGNWNPNPPSQAPAYPYASPNPASPYTYGQPSNTVPPQPTPSWGGPTPNANANPIPSPYHPVQPPSNFHPNQEPPLRDERPMNQMEGYSGSGWGGRGRGRGGSFGPRGRGRGGRGGPSSPPSFGSRGGLTSPPSSNAWADLDSANRPRKTGRSAKRGR